MVRGNGRSVSFFFPRVTANISAAFHPYCGTRRSMIDDFRMGVPPICHDLRRFTANRTICRADPCRSPRRASPARCRSVAATRQRPRRVNFNFRARHWESFRASKLIRKVVAKGQRYSRSQLLNHTIHGRKLIRFGAILLDRKGKAQKRPPSYCRAACCCILDYGRVDTSVILACRCNTATHPVVFDTHLYRLRRTRCSGAIRGPTRARAAPTAPRSWSLRGPGCLSIPGAPV